MSRFHGAKQSRTETEKHLNWMGGASYFLSDPIKTLRMAASSCFFGEPMYYHRDKSDTRAVKFAPNYRLTDRDVKYLREELNAVDKQEWRSMTPAEMMESAIDAALNHDPEATLVEAARLRNEDHVRTTPQVILVRAAHHKKVKGTGLVRKYAPQIVTRADEPSVGLAYHFWRYGKGAPVPNALKRAWADYLEKLPYRVLAKYKMEDKSVKTVDVVNIVHPKSEAVGKLVKGELKLNETTWESVLSKNGSTPETWTKALDVMGHMALLRNIRNLLKAGVKPDSFLKKLVEGAKTGKQLPFRYWSAYTAVQAESAPGSVLDAIEECLTLSLENLPKFSGRLMALCDNSGSARGATTSALGTVQVSTIANLTAILAAVQADDGHVGVFGDRLSTFTARKASSIFDQLDKANNLGEKVGQNTENGIWLFWDKAIKEKEHWDHVFVMSDMQAGHGGLYGTDPRYYRDYLWKDNRCIDVAKLINHYRRTVNPNVLVYLIQVAGYTDTILPEFYDKTFILGGWSDGVLRFAGEMAKLFTGNQQVNQ